MRLALFSLPLSRNFSRAALVRRAREAGEEEHAGDTGYFEQEHGKAKAAFAGDGDGARGSGAVRAVGELPSRARAPRARSRRKSLGTVAREVQGDPGAARPRRPPPSSRGPGSGRPDQGDRPPRARRRTRGSPPSRSFEGRSSSTSARRSRRRGRRSSGHGIRRGSREPGVRIEAMKQRETAHGPLIPPRLARSGHDAPGGRTPPGAFSCEPDARPGRRRAPRTRCRREWRGV